MVTMSLYPINIHKLTTISSSSFNTKILENPCRGAFKCLTFLMIFYLHDFKDMLCVYQQCFYDNYLVFILMFVINISMVIFIV
jgi:hypothetical protein